MASAAEMPKRSDKVVNLLELPPGTDVFFDDDETNVDSVTASIQKYNEEHSSDQILLKAIHCPPDPDNLSLINSNGRHVKVRDLTDYIILKTSGPNATALSENLKTRIREAPITTKKDKRICSNGLTIEMIDQIIGFDKRTEGKSDFFFDFDGLLTLVQSFPFFDEVTADIPGFANYLFSDHIGVEPHTGRLAKLKEMFTLIGPERAYIITNNTLARISKSNPAVRANLCAIIEQIIPSFDSTHLKMTLPVSDDPNDPDNKIPDKGRTILFFLRPKPAGASAGASSGGPAGGPAGGMKRSKFRKTYRNRKSLSRARKMRSHKHNIAAHNKRRHSKKSKK